MVRRILCYGDSNTWAPDMDNGGRLDERTRWTGQLGMLLGDDYIVIEEGLGGRTTVLDDPYEPHRNGRTYLTPSLLSHQPLDAVVLTLGTNDCKSRFAVTPEDIGRGLALLCDDIAHVLGGTVKILVVAPAALGDRVDPEDMFGPGIPVSRQLGRIFGDLARSRGLGFFDASSVITLDHHDGIHLSARDHAALADALAPRVQSLFKS